MRRLVNVAFNGQRFSAYPGDVLLDAALLNGVGMPHDCRSGSCGACVVRLVSGRTLGGEAREPGTIHACQARALTDLEISTDEAPEVVRRQGKLEGVSALADDILEVVIVPARPMTILPGQYVKLEFAGFPARAYSPTPPLDPRAAGDGRLRFHVRRFGNGRVSGELGKAIAMGHKVRISGPLGAAYLRRGLQNRLVLVSGGTGFAPIWAIADAALRERPSRSMLLIVGVRSVRALYMVKALDLMASCPNVRILVTSEERQTVTTVILPGRPTDYLPPLLARDVVYAAGSATLVGKVAETAAVSGASFYADAFVPADENEPRGWLGRVFGGRSTRVADTSVISKAPAPSPHLANTERDRPDVRQPRRH